MNENEKHLEEAVLEAKKRLGFTEPNPAVGAILVKNGTVLSRGFHKGAGEPHAEVEALKGVSQSESEGSTLYVTLEPCCHHGRTPPCTDLIVQRAIHKVVFGAFDPNPLVKGNGCEILKSHNIEVEQCTTESVKELYRAYTHWQLTKRPYVTLKIAISKDGKIAGRSGARVKLTCEETDIFTHQMRRDSSAILTTAKTVNTDDPLFDCRLVSTDKKKIFVVQRQTPLKKNLKIFQSASEVCVLSDNALFKTLGEKGLHSLWVEAGATFSKYLLESKLVDCLFVYESPVIVGEGISFALNQDLFSSFHSYREFKSGSDLIKRYSV